MPYPPMLGRRLCRRVRASESALEAKLTSSDGRCDGPDGRIAEAPRQVLPAETTEDGHEPLRRGGAGPSSREPVGGRAMPALSRPRSFMAFIIAIGSR